MAEMSKKSLNTVALSNFVLVFELVIVEYEKSDSYFGGPFW